MYLVVDSPANVLEVGIVEKIGVILLHPLPNLIHTYRSKNNVIREKN